MTDALPTPTPPPYPARLDGQLDPSLSRWVWIFKWLLLIPHYFVLFFLYLAAGVTVTIAWFAILFTGRYPRSLFDFNVGVLRWSWRVSYYGSNAFATDHYPPFSLQPDPDFPSDFAVEYPETLSRGLVLVKAWLLAIPQYIVLYFLSIASGAAVFVAAIVLLFTGSYPPGIYDFVMGVNRWSYRVSAYAFLMRDEYPPFRLDSGGADPAAL